MMRWISRAYGRHPFETQMIVLVIVAALSLVAMPLWINGGKPQIINIEQEPY